MGEAKRRQNAPMWREIDGLRQQTVGKLKVKDLEVFGEESRSNHEQFLIRLAWRPTPKATCRSGPTRADGTSAADHAPAGLGAEV